MLFVLFCSFFNDLLCFVLLFVCLFLFCVVLHVLYDLFFVVAPRSVLQFRRFVVPPLSALLFFPRYFIVCVGCFCLLCCCFSVAFFGVVVLYPACLFVCLFVCLLACFFVSLLPRLFNRLSYIRLVLILWQLFYVFSLMLFYVWFVPACSLFRFCVLFVLPFLPVLLLLLVFCSVYTYNPCLCFQ